MQNRVFLDNLAKKLQFNNWQDWYKITFSKLDKSYFPPNSNNFGIKEILEAYPEHKWEVWKFTRIPSNFWKDVQNRRNFFLSLQEKLKLKSREDWYNINGCKEMRYHGGHSLLLQYKYSFPKAIMDSFPECDWKPWKFSQVPNGYWDDISNQREFMLDLGKSLQIEKHEQWYDVKSEDIRKHGGGGLLVKYHNCYMTAISTILHEYNWEMWKFKKTPKDFWLNLENQRKFIIAMEKRLGITDWEDWYQVNQQTFISHDGRPLLRIYGSLYPILKAAYPERGWEPEKFKAISWKVKTTGMPSTFKSQMMLFSNISQALPGLDVHVNYQIQT